MEHTMDVDDGRTTPQPPVRAVSADSFSLLTPPPPQREPFRDIPVKVHIRRPERDEWKYLGRGIATYEHSEHSSRVVIRSLTSRAEIVVFNEGTDLQAEKRGKFVILACVDGTRVVSWSFNALNNSQTLRLMASIELACNQPTMQRNLKRRVERVIRDDRQRRHNRRKAQEAMIDAFARQNIAEQPPVD